jgi:PAS domain S-box-containing protein
MGWGIFHFRLFDLVPVARTTVIEEMDAGIIVLDRRNRVIDINPRAKEMFAIDSKNGCLGNTLSEISGRLSILANFISFADEQDSLQKEFTLETRGEEYYYELFSSPIRDYRQELVARVLIINDITDVKRARDKLNTQKKELAVMDERERMARDLHDNLGQILSFSSVQIQTVRQQFKKENFKQADEYLQELKEIIRDAHKEIREYVYNIRDNTDYNENFIGLLKTIIGKFRKNSEVEVNLKTDFRQIEGCSGDKLANFLGTEEKMQLINVVKESLTNILKYAEADTVNILLGDKAGNFEIIIEDNGKGIDKLKEKSGSGINIMNERARLIGGQLKIESESNLGTRVIVTLPVDWGNNCENNDS